MCGVGVLDGGDTGELLVGNGCCCLVPPLCGWGGMVVVRLVGGDGHPVGS